MKDTSAHAHDK